MTRQTETQRIMSPYRHKNLVWSLLTLSTFLLGLGLGGLLAKYTPEMWFLGSFAAAFLFILAAAMKYRSATRSRHLMKNILRQGVDLNKVKDSLIRYGSQPAIIRAEGLESHFIKVSKRSVLINHAPLVIIEHNSGSEVLIRCEDVGRDYHLQKGSLLRMDFAKGETSRKITFIPLEESTESSSYVLVHLLMNE